jgi:hypothetical protein
MQSRITSAIDLAHAALAEEGQELVSTEANSRGEGQIG